MSTDRRTARLPTGATRSTGRPATDDALDSAAGHLLNGGSTELREWLDRADLGTRRDLIDRLGSVGNAGVAALVGGRAPVVQRDGADPDPADGDPQQLGVIGDLFDPIGPIWAAVVASNIAVASKINVPASYPAQLNSYAAANGDDGATLTAGLANSPDYYTGGWILDVQTGAKAITLGSAVFVNGSLDVDTYVHEMVHVNQYAMLGPTAFLVSYFGLSAMEIARRLVRRLPLDPMSSSPQEAQAYAIEGRFRTWRRAQPSGSSGTTAP
jgi:hypothetical protein